MRKVWPILSIAIFTLFAHDRASACVCELLSHPSAQQIKAAAAKEINQAKVVFFGEVIDLGEFDVKFKVGQVYKGKVGDKIKLQTGTRKAGDGLIIVSTCDYRFQSGQKYLVYAGGAGPAWQADKCGGTVEARYAFAKIKILAEVMSEETKAGGKGAERQNAFPKGNI